MAKKRRQKQTDGVFLRPEGDLKRPRSPQVMIICLLFALLLTMGLINLYSASIGAGYFKGQIKSLALTLSAFILFGWVIPIRQINAYAYWFFGFICILLVIVDLTGRTAGGAQRWISLGPASFQPSEFAKLAVVMTVARFFSSNRQDSPYTIRDLLPLAAIISVAFFLIVTQPDLGTAGVCCLIAFCQLAFVRIDLKSIGIVVSAVPIIVAMAWNFYLMPYQRLRVLNFVSPELDPRNSGYHALQSLIAVGSGGVFGKGFTMGTQTHLHFLPERHTDFIFSVFAEEHGFWGCALIFIIFGLMTYVALDIARHARDTFSAMLAVGVAALIFLEFSINVAMVMGWFPVVGIPLPLFSFGGSAMLTVCVSLGLLISVNRANSGASKRI
ncbi:MAG: rod shape-determining protein RodA [Chitinophagaceae bacterium]|nr:rod shape-determining protein RodA [Oligoflexus sp.]